MPLRSSVSGTFVCFIQTSSTLIRHHYLTDNIQGGSSHVLESRICFNCPMCAARQAGTNKEQTPTDSSIPTSTFAAIRFPQFSVGSARKWMAFCSSVRARIDEETDRRMRGRRRSVANVRTLRDIQTNASGLVRWCGRPRRLDRTQAIRESIVWTLSGQYSAVGAGNIVSVSGQWGRNIDRYQCNVCKLVCLILWGNGAGVHYLVTKLLRIL